MASYRPYPSQSSFGVPHPTPSQAPQPHAPQYSQNWNVGSSDGSMTLGPRPLQPSLFQQTYNQKHNQNGSFRQGGHGASHSHDHHYTYKPPPPQESSYQPLQQSSMIPQSQLQSAPSSYYSSSRYSQFGHPSAQDHMKQPPGPPSPPPSSSLPPPPDPPSNRNKASASDGLFHDKGGSAAHDSVVALRKRDSMAASHSIAPPKQKQVFDKKGDVLGGRVESEEERRVRKKREMEKQLRDERHRKQLRESQNTVLQKTQILSSGIKGNSALFGSRMIEKRTTTPFLSSDKIENRLKKPTTFLCKMKFRNELPDPSAQPKLLSLKRDKDLFSRYAITTLEKMHKPELHIEPDLGIPLDLLDLSVYNRPGAKQHLDPEDEELLRSDDMVTPMKTNGLKIKDRPTDKGMSWLVKTQYISSLSAEATKQSMTEKQAKELRETRGGQNILEIITSREGKIHAIEESFRASKLRPVHSTNNKLQPVEVLPLFPEFDRFDDQFVVATFDSAPTAESEMFRSLDEAVRDEHESKAIMKSFIATGADPSRPEKFLAYMVPSLDELSKNQYDESEEVAYTWVREYHWDAKGEDSEDPSTYLLSFDHGQARYLPLSTKLVLRKKRAKEGRSIDDIEYYPVPSSVTVRRGSVVSAVQMEEDRRVASGSRNVRRRVERNGGEDVDEDGEREEETRGDGEEDMDVFNGGGGGEEEEDEEMSE